MSRPHISSAALSPAAVPLIHLKKAPSQSQATVHSADTHTVSSDDLPTHGQTLRRSRSNTSLEILTDIVFAALSAVFFVYGLYVVHFDGKAVADHRTATDRLINATKIGPTIFPILFAAVLGRALKAIMLWRLERGEKLGLLDLLAGSTTVVNTILTQVSLRTLSVAGLTLIVAWAVSPLGGQASLRVMTVAQQNTTSTVPVRYMSTNHSYGSYTLADLGPVILLWNGLYNAAVLGPERIKNSPTDQWNNVKVPHLGSLVTDKIQVANHSWITVPDTNVTYASLIGLPVADLPSTGNASFTMESFYWDLDCSNLTESWQPPGYNGSNAPAGCLNRTDGTSIVGTIILDYEPPGAYLDSEDGFVTPCQANPYDPEYMPRVLAYNSYDPSGSQFGALCAIRTAYVEVQTECTGITNCSATAIRSSTLPHPNPAWTILDGPAGVEGNEETCNWYIYFLQSFAQAITVQNSGTATPVQGYLLDPNSPASPLVAGAMTSVPIETFEIRLAQLLNSFWSITAGAYVVPYGLEANRDQGGTPANVTSTTAELTETFDVIRCHRAWLGVLLGSSIFLIAASMLTIALRLGSKTPDLSLNWSTLTRDNPYVETSYSSSSLDDAKRSRLMKDKKVRFGDVEPERELGHLAVGSLETKGVARVDKRRIFD